ncbi:MAG: DNA mismatch repair endonuclease MutL, partial [Elusimicrobiota bacterium]
MPHIARLSPETAARIAAGEVVERPASVLKELLENSLDAGASRIDIETRGAGRELLRVSDDGCGMDAADCRLAVERHATSKITSLDDLETLATFGFRGEALYAAAAVSKLTLQSFPRGGKAGRRLELEGGKLLSERDAPPVPGTSVEVKDLFFNTPARLKFLKSDASEKSRMLRVVEEAAMADPAVSFTYRSEGRVLLKFPAQKGKDAFAALRLRAAEALGAELCDGLLAVKTEPPGLSLWGLISPADNMPATRSFQFFFINRRPVQSRILQQALYRAYEPFRPRSRHPAAALFLTLPASEIDVNVHPTKSEVRFRRERAVFEAVASSASRALLDSKGIPTLSDAGASPAVLDRPYAFDSSVPIGGAAPVSEPSLFFAEPENRGRRWAESPRYLGQVEKTYLVFDAGGGLLVFDQHAAQERVLFERFSERIRSGKPFVQKLMLPISMDMPASQRTRVLARKKELREAGFEVEPYGKMTLQVTAVPDLFDKTADIREMIERVLERFQSPGAAKAQTRYDGAALMACKASVKAHDPLDEREALQLAADLALCRDMSCCP